MKFDHFKKLVDSMFVPDGSGGVLQRYEGVDAKNLNPLVLAYIGDAYFHLFVRGRILSYEQSKVQVLNQFSAQIVSAVWQARVSKVAAALMKPWSQPRTAAPVKLRSGATRLTPPISAPPGSTRARGVL